MEKELETREEMVCERTKEAEAARESSPRKWRRSLSLQDLSPGRANQFRVKDLLNDSLEEGERTQRLAWKGYTAFIKNSSRKQRSRMKNQHKETAGLKQKINQLNIQIVSLKSLLTSADQVVMNWAREIHENKKRIMEEIRKNVLLEEKSAEQGEKVGMLAEALEAARKELSNCHNSQLLLRADCSNFELQLQRERDKVVLLRKDKGALEDKVEYLTNMFNEKVKKLNEVENGLAELRAAMEGQALLLAEANRQRNEDSRLLKNTGKELDQLNREVTTLIKMNKQLKEEAFDLKKKLDENEKKYAANEETYKQQLNKLKIVCATNENNYWRSNIAKAASSMVFSTLHFINALAFPAQHPFSS